MGKNNKLWCSRTGAACATRSVLGKRFKGVLVGTESKTAALDFVDESGRVGVVIEILFLFVKVFTHTVLVDKSPGQKDKGDNDEKGNANHF